MWPTNIPEILWKKFPQGFGDRPLPALWTPGRPGQLGRVLSRDQVAGGECSSGKKKRLHGFWFCQECGWRGWRWTNNKRRVCGERFESNFHFLNSPFRCEIMKLRIATQMSETIYDTAQSWSKQTISVLEGLQSKFINDLLLTKRVNRDDLENYDGTAVPISL